MKAYFWVHIRIIVIQNVILSILKKNIFKNVLVYLSYIPNCVGINLFLFVNQQNERATLEFLVLMNFLFKFVF